MMGVDSPHILSHGSERVGDKSHYPRLKQTAGQSFRYTVFMFDYYKDVPYCLHGILKTVTWKGK